MIVPDDVPMENLGAVVLKGKINFRFRMKKNTFFGIVGESGDGKSYTALKLALHIDPDFTIKKQVLYNPADFLTTINELRKTKKHKVLVLDEMHVTAPARMWYDFSNIALCHIAATFRRLKRLCVFVVTPNVRWIDPHFREMLNIYSIASRTHPELPTYIRPYELKVNLYDIENPRIYLKKIWFYWKGFSRVLKEVWVRKIPEELAEEYERESEKFKAKILERVLEKIIQKFQKKMGKGKDYERMAEELLKSEEIQRAIFKKGKIQLTKLVQFYGLTAREAKEFRDVILKKMREVGMIA